jgi:hypothetical protein
MYPVGDATPASQGKARAPTSPCVCAPPAAACASGLEGLPLLSLSTPSQHVPGEAMNTDGRRRRWW